MEMSYKRAWDLVEEMNRLFGKPLVAAQTGGKRLPYDRIAIRS